MPRSYALSQLHFGSKKRNPDLRRLELERSDNGESEKRRNPE
jgi:hypothetical protein